MTEAEWLACTDARLMLSSLRDQGAGERKMRLFAVACCRRIWHLFPLALPEAGVVDCRDAVEVAERFADGRASVADLESADRRARQYVPLFHEFNTADRATATASQAAEAAREAVGETPSYLGLAAIRRRAAAAEAKREKAERAEQESLANLLRDIFTTPSARRSPATSPGRRGKTTPSRSSPGPSTTTATCPSAAWTPPGLASLETPWRTPAAPMKTS
jgi:hypothetical protein